MKFSIKNFFSKFDQIDSFLMENFIFWAVYDVNYIESFYNWVRLEPYNLEKVFFTWKLWWKSSHCIKYAKIRIFTGPYSPVLGQNLRLCPYTGGYRSVS